MTMILNNNQPVTTEAQLNAAIAQANGAAAGSGALQIELGGNIALSTALTAISLKSGVTLDIAGGASVLDGGGQQQGLFVYSGVVTIENLTVQNMLARGTNGGAGLGGGLFVADDAANGAAPGAVTLTNVSFNHDSAVGGDGGGANGGYGGGGGGFDAGSGVALGGGFGDGGGGGGSGYGAPNPPGGSTGGNPGGPGGNGGFGGGGGGGGGGWWFAAPGGGGYAGFGGGNGGGGGHGAAGTTSNGRGAGNGGGGGGGGGLGAGGDIFVQQGASLTIGGNSSLSAGSVAGGAGGVGAGGAPGPQSHENGGGPGGTGGSGSAGAAFGNGIFLQGNQSVTFAPGAGQTETISGVIADQTGSGGSGANAGAGSIVVDGPGTLALSAANTFTGGVTIEQGALELTAPGVAGSGAISFAANPGESATLVIDAAATPANGQVFATTIADFGDGDAIDLPGLGYGYASSATLAGDVLTVTSNQQTLYFTLSDPGATKFYVHNDGANHVLVNDIPSLPSTNASWAGASADWNAASAWKGGVVANGFSTNATIAVAGGYVVRVAAAESFALQNLTLDNAKATLALAGKLTISGGLTLTAGTIQLDNGNLLAGLFSVAAKSEIVGDGALGGAIQSKGVIEASGGLLDIAGAVSGDGGVLAIANGATLELGGAAAQNAISFANGAHAVLKLDSPASVSSEITGFTAADTIDIAGMIVSSDRYAGGVLTLFDGAAQLASLSIGGSYLGKVFALSADGAGGTDIALAPNSAPQIAAPGAQALEVNRHIGLAVTISDPDAAAANQTLTVTLSDKLGMLSVTGGAGGAVTGSGTAKLTIVGLLSQVDAELATLTYNAAQPGKDVITVNASDGDGGKAAAQKIAVTTTADTTLILNGGQPVTTEAELNAAIAQAATEQPNSGVYQIQLGANIALASELSVISMKSGATLDIEGNGYTLDGSGQQEGLFVYSGKVTIENLTLQNMVARGGNGEGGSYGGGGAGGGAGLGGGLFIADDAPNGAAAGNVTLTGVSFANDAAIGGSGGRGGYVIYDTTGGRYASDFGNGQPGDLNGDKGFLAYGFGNGDGGEGGGIYGFGAGSGGLAGSSYEPDSYTALGGGGGGGLGAGGDIFVQQGASLTIAGGSSLGAGTAYGGGYGGSNVYKGGGSGGGGYGNGIFLAGDQTMTFAPGAGDTQTISGQIADMTGSQDPSGATGTGSLVLNGPGALVLDADNTFTGGVTIEQGTLGLATVGAGGSGAITFAPQAGAEATLVIDAAATPAGGQIFANTIADFGAGKFGSNDAIDVKGLIWAPGATAIIFNGNVLAVSSDGQRVDFAIANPGAANFTVSEDATGDVLVKAAAPITTEAALNAAIQQIDDAPAGSGVAVIRLAGNIKLTTTLAQIDLQAGVTLDIEGGGYALIGGYQESGLSVHAGAVTIENLTIEEMRAQGVTAKSGGGDAGLGGGLFIANHSASGEVAGNVTLTNVSFVNDQAIGGAGAASGSGKPGQSGAFGAGGGYGNGQAGFGGGNGAAGGGGGLGAGGDIFVEQGASLTIDGGSLGTGSVTGGAGSDGGAKGHAYGGAIFLQGDQVLTFAPAAGATETVSGVIADMTGSKDPSGQAGSGAVVVDGAGLVALSAANSFTGGVTIESGALELATAGAAGAGTITFAGSAATLVLASPSLANALSGLGAGDQIDLLGVTANAAMLNGPNQLLVTDNGATVAQFTGAFNPDDDYSTASDGHGGTFVVVTADQPPLITAPTTALDQAGQSLAIGGVSIADADAGAYGETTTIVLSDSKGLLSAVATPGATVTGAGTTSLTLSGALSAVDAELATLTYADPVAGDATADMIRLQSSDGRGGADSQTIDVTINQPPVTTVPGAQLDQAGQSVAIGGISVSDSDAVSAEKTITVVLSDSTGELSDSPASWVGAAVSGSGTTSLTISGSIWAVNIALGLLDYTDPAAGDATADTITVDASDGRGGSSAGSIGVSINLPPVIHVPGAKADQAGQSLAIGGISVGDTTSAGGTFTVTLSDKTGALSATAATGGTVAGAGTTTLTLSGSLAAVNAELASLTYVDPGQGAIADTISLLADDDRGGSGAASVAIAINSVYAAWNAGKSADWSLASAWTSGIAPNNYGTDATIAKPGSYTVGIAAGESYAVGALAIDSGNAVLGLAGALTTVNGVTLTAGTIDLVAGGTLGGAVSVAAGSQIVGAGSVTGPIVNAGMVEASGGLLTITGAVSGTAGTLAVGNGGVLEIGGATSGQGFAFASGAIGTLKLDNLGAAAGAISGFVVGDTIDLANQIVTTDKFSNGVLTLFDGSATVGSLTLTGNFYGDIFPVAGDGGKGTDITLFDTIPPPTTTEQLLNIAIQRADKAAANSGAQVITLAGNIDLTTALTAIDLNPGVTLDIEGAGFTLDGGEGEAGLVVQSGKVTIENLTLQHMVVQGANGAAGSGGGAGLGGGLFIANGAAVTLTDVSFNHDSAIGGAGAGSGVGSGGQSGGFGMGGGYGEGPGGFGGGNGGATGGGGGLGAGGDIFVQQGGSLTITGGSIAAGTVTAGKGAGGGAAGGAYGGGIFIQGYQSITLAPAAGQTDTISGIIADMTGSKDPSGQTGAGGIIVNGAGTLALSAANTFTGGVTIDSGTLELSATNAAGTGNINFNGAGTALKIDSGIAARNYVQGFTTGDTIDFAGVSATSDQFLGNSLILFDGSAQVATLKFNQGFYNQIFALSPDGAGGTDVTLEPNAPPTVALPGTQTVVVNSTTPVPGIIVTDPDAVIANETITVTLDLLTDTYGYKGKFGVMTVQDVGGLVQRSGNSKVTVSGTVAQVNADLATLDYISPSVTQNLMIVVSVDDGNGGQATGNIPITITPAPDAGSAALPPSRNPALFIQAIAAFGASHAWLTDRADAMAMPGSHLDLAAARQ